MTNENQFSIQETMSYPLDNIPQNAPRMGNAFTRFIGRILLRIVGYKIEGTFANEPKMILIASPHTSNWDLILALGTILSLGVRLNFMMKKEAFFFPLERIVYGAWRRPPRPEQPKSCG